MDGERDRLAVPHLDHHLRALPHLDGGAWDSSVHCPSRKHTHRGNASTYELLAKKRHAVASVYRPRMKEHALGTPGAGGGLLLTGPQVG